MPSYLVVPNVLGRLPAQLLPTLAEMGITTNHTADLMSCTDTTYAERTVTVLPLGQDLLARSNELPRRPSFLYHVGWDGSATTLHPVWS